MRQIVTIKMREHYGCNSIACVNLPPFIYEERHLSVREQNETARNHHTTIEPAVMLNTAPAPLGLGVGISFTTKMDAASLARSGAKVD